VNQRPDAAAAKRPSFYTFKGEVEYRVEMDSGWLLNRETGNVTPWDGIRILYRAPGERRWSKRVIVPDEALGQTVESLRADAPEIALELLRGEVNVDAR